MIAHAQYQQIETALVILRCEKSHGAFQTERDSSRELMMLTWHTGTEIMQAQHAQVGRQARTHLKPGHSSSVGHSPSILGLSKPINMPCVSLPAAPA